MVGNVRKGSGSHLEFTETIRKDSCTILQHHVFNLISSNDLTSAGHCCGGNFVGKENLSGRFIWCLTDLTRAEIGFWYKPNFNVKSGMLKFTRLQEFGSVVNDMLCMLY